LASKQAKNIGICHLLSVSYGNHHKGDSRIPVKIRRAFMRYISATLEPLQLGSSLLIAIFFAMCCLSCKSEIRVSTTGAVTAALVTQIRPVVAKPGDDVSLIGKNLKSAKSYSAVLKLGDGSSKAAPVKIIDSTTGIFKMPEGAGLGERQLEILEFETKLATFVMVADEIGNSLKIYTGDSSDVCSSRLYIDKNGRTQTGTKNCGSSSVADCTTEGQTGCKNTRAFISADVAKVVAGNIKSGVTLGGVTGSYPSSTYPLSDATSTTDLTNFTTQLTSDGTFEFWDSAGTRHTGSGDGDFIAANVKSGVTFENLSITGSLAVPNVWDVRLGTAVGTTTGLLKLNCRNGANLSYFDQADYPKSAVADNTTDTLTVTLHGYSNNEKIKILYEVAPNGLSYNTVYYVRNATPNTFQVALSSGGSPVNFTDNGTSVGVYKHGNTVTEIWDSIDDDNGASTAIPTYTGWSDNNTCGGIEAANDDGNIWKDVTTTGDGVTASTCTATAAHCALKDKISGLQWHKADATGRDWSAALSFCDGLSYNGKTDWRLPTQKELMDATSHGMISTAGYTNWITLTNLRSYSYWSSSTTSNDHNRGWSFNFASSFTSGGTGAEKYGANYRVICVRP
jgi:hypothetical protein